MEALRIISTTLLVLFLTLMIAALLYGFKKREVDKYSLNVSLAFIVGTLFILITLWVI